MSRIMGLDIGDKKIGVALSDPSQILATPLKTIIRLNDESAILEIINLVNQHGVTKLVVGLPYSLDGTIGQQAEKVLLFKENITAKTDIGIIMQDERLSSVMAEQKLGEACKKRGKLKSDMDAAAATVILQSYLDEVLLNGEISQLAPPSF